MIQSGAQGLDMPPVELHADASPNLHGSIYRSARYAQREVMIPVYIHGIDRRTLLRLKRQLTDALDPLNGYCVLKFMEGDSQPRYLRAYYKGGLEGDEGEDQAGFRWSRFGIQLTAFDPWFYSDQMQVAEWKFGQGASFLTTQDGSFLPLHLEKGLVSTPDLSVYNPGDVDAWPIWELTGPVRGFKFSFAGRSFEIPASGADVVAAGRTLTVDTRPGYKTLRDNQGKNYWSSLAPNPQLWPIPAGWSSISVEMAPGSGASSLRLSFKPRFKCY
ncbi:MULTISPECIES: phage tail domain-containing protein [Streptomyces]|uniref:phage tail domain-containing protein n=1 Tax=Streptomyces TaxID=1883 RepID=UPI001E34B9D5|nr:MULTISPECIES: phage tail domain-containing protein [Streptomyces]UFQ16416.1 phage tail family protein [Streptomyces huasconensis]WCL86019.1 phage tail family protein [Streptomyces sp. JCM 35825]